jgi:23S rRNA (uracil1939-C5)-methyltransferase
MIRTGRVARFAPTGEGVIRGDGRVVFVDGALPGETVEFEVFERRTRFERARAGRILEPSPDRRAMSPHAAQCGGTDWAHVSIGPAREAKRRLFLETMERIGKLDAGTFGELPIAESALEYRLRNQFHFRREGSAIRAGFFERRSRRIVPLDACEIVSGAGRRWISETSETLFTELKPGEAARIETVETVEVRREGFRLAARATPGGILPSSTPAWLDLELPGGPLFRVSAGSFFQVNRHRIGPFWRSIRDLAADLAVRSVIEAYAGGGYFASALLAAGCRVTSVESEPSSAEDARQNALRWGSGDAWEYDASGIERHLDRDASSADLVVADPPRAGLRGVASLLAARARRFFLYVSCEPPTLARDLAVLSASGFRIARAWLEDFFPLTHRVEAAVLLARNP